MSETTTAPVVKSTLKSKLNRKTLILTAAAVGLIIAGGLAVKKASTDELEIEIVEPDTEA